MYWNNFKKITEECFEDIEYEECCGFQIQTGTKWNKGLSDIEIKQLERKIGFEFPYEYLKMLSVMNGFDRENISIDPDEVYENEFKRICYKYPEDFKNVKWLLDDIDENIKYINYELDSQGLNSKDVTGFIPLYLHRALVVFKDKELSPVISIYGNDVVIFGNSLIEYWKSEFEYECF